MKVPNFLIHEFIKWTTKDDQGEFSHQGQIILLDETKVMFHTKLGVMTVDYNDGEFEKIKALKSDELETAPRVPVTPTREPIAIVARRRELKMDTKLAKAYDLYQKLEDKSRKHVIKMFTEQLGMTPAGASTYQAICKKKFG